MRTLLLALTCALIAAVVAPSAEAADGFRPVLAFAGTPEDRVDPFGSAADPSGNVFVVDYIKNRIVKFDPSGAVIDTFGQPGTGAGQLTFPVGMTRSPSTGHLFVIDSGNKRIAEFDHAGAFVRAFGWGVSDGQAQFQICASSCRAGIAGAGGGQLGEVSLSMPTVSPATDELFVPDPANHRVQVFDASGAYLRSITGSGANTLDSPSAAAFGPDGNLYVTDKFQGRIQAFNAAGDFVSEFAAGLLASGTGFALPGLAFDAAGNAYVSQHEHISQIDPTGSTVLAEFGSAGGPLTFDASSGRIVGSEIFGGRALAYAFGKLPDATTGTATDVELMTATVNGTVNPHDNVTAFHVEYGLDTTYGSRAPDAELDVGSDSTDHPVSHEITGLQHTTTYHYRVVATVFGSPVYGEDQTFTTAPFTGSAITGDASSVSAGTATVSATVNPGGIATQFHIEYGPTTDYGSQSAGGDAGDDSSDHTVSQELTGLQPTTTYHYRVVLESAGNVLARGQDRVFTTRSPPGSAITGRVSELTLESATIHATINPGGKPASYHFEYGTDSRYGSQVPASDVDLPADSNDHAVSAALTGLRGGVTYHYRVALTSDGSTVRSEDRTFATIIAPVASTGAALAVSQNEARLGATVQPNGGETRYRIEYGPDQTYGRFAPDTGDAVVRAGLRERQVFQGVSGLAPNTTYRYRVVAVNGAGESVGEERTFTTLPEAPAVSTGAASSISRTAATLAGTVDPRGVATTYRFLVTTAAGAAPVLAEQALGGVSERAVGVTLTRLRPGTAYGYRLIATNAGGTTIGAEQTFTTAPVLSGRLVLGERAGVNGRFAAVPVSCRRAIGARCVASLRLTVRRSGKQIVVGSAQVRMRTGERRRVPVALTAAARRLLRAQDGRLSVTATATIDGEVVAQRRIALRRD